jgi:predicted nucleic acid-binding protein
LIALLRGDAPAAESIGNLESKGITTCTTPVNAYELFVGAWRSSRSEANLRESASLLRDLPILIYDVEAAFQIARIHSALSRRGELIGIEDEFIAGITLRYGEPLVTRNLSHFGRIPGLEIIAW